MVIPTSSPACPGHFLTSSSERQGFPPQYFPICECHLKGFPTIPLPYGRAMGVVTANPYCQNQAFFFLILLLFWENLAAFPNRSLLFWDPIQLSRDHRRRGWRVEIMLPYIWKDPQALPTLKSGASPQCTKHIPN